jgi:hypothetical protein
MKVQAVVYPSTLPVLNKNECNKRLFNKSKADLILFPGWSFKDPAHIEDFKKSITNTKTLGIFDLKDIQSRGLSNALFAVYKGELKFISFQLFTTSVEISDNPLLGQLFLDEFKDNRVFEVKGKRVRVIHCGEWNILRNEQNHCIPNKVKFRFSDLVMERQFLKTLNETSLILNPQHSPMGNQGKMSKRRSYLSANNRGYVSAGNVRLIADLDSTKSAHYACFNGYELERNLIDEGKYFRLYEYDLKF